MDKATGMNGLELGGVAQLVQEEVQRSIADAMTSFRAALESAAELESLKRKEILSEREVERLFGVPASTLRTKRCRGCGPAYIKDGASVYYTPSAVRDYLNARRVKTHDQIGG